MIKSRRNGRDAAADDLFGLTVEESAPAKLAIAIVTHGPQAAVGLEKQAVIASRRGVCYVGLAEGSCLHGQRDDSNDETGSYHPGMLCWVNRLRLASGMPRPFLGQTLRISKHAR